MRKEYFRITSALVLFACALIYFLFFTASGSGFIIRLFLYGYLGPGNIGIRKIEGSLSRTLILHDIEAGDIKRLLPGSRLEIQRLETYLTPFGFRGLDIKVFNGRLKLSQFNTILFYGDYRSSAMNLTVYSGSLNVSAIPVLFTEAAGLKNLSGKLYNIDINIKGPLLEPEISGEFRIDKFLWESFSITDCPVSLSLQLKNIRKSPRLYGEASLKNGLVSGKKAAAVNLQESKILFKGAPENPSFDLRGTSKVGRTKINITLKGTINKPELKLTSRPSMPQERLLIMLATNKTWESSSDTLSKGELSAGLAKDFLDYFLFSGSESKIAQYFGISDLSLTLEKEKRGFGAKKSVSDKLDATYAIEQSQVKEKGAAITQKIGGEYRVTDIISVGAEKELKQDDKAGGSQEKQKTDDKVLLKFKKEF